MMHTVTRWNPWKELETVQNQWNAALSQSAPGTKSLWTPPVDIEEDEKAFTILMEVPDVTLKDVDVRVEDGTLYICGARQREEPKEGVKIHRVERVWGTFRRTFKLPDNVDEEGIAASLKQGVLTVSLPKAERARARSVEIRAE